MSQQQPNNNKAPWPVRAGIFRSIGQNDFVPNRSPSPIVEMPMSPSSARSSPARFVPGYNRSMSPRITIEESPFSPPPQTPSSVMSPPVFLPRQSPPPLTQSSRSNSPAPHPQSRLQSPPPMMIATSMARALSPPIVREVPIQQEQNNMQQGSEVIDRKSTTVDHCWLFATGR